MSPANGEDGFSVNQKAELQGIVDIRISERLATLKNQSKIFLVGLGAFLLLGITWKDLRFFIFEKAYPPEHVYGQLKEQVRSDSDLRIEIAKDISNLLGERVDSGYSKVVVFGREVPFKEGDNVLQFYARDKQRVILSVRAQGSASARFTIAVDRKPLVNIGGIAQDSGYAFPYQTFVDITSELQQGPAPHAADPAANVKNSQLNIHTVSVMPNVLLASEFATFELLVIVRNES